MNLPNRNSTEAAGMKERAGIQSVEVGFGLLEVLSKAAGPLMLPRSAAAAGMSAAKAHRYLVSFPTAAAWWCRTRPAPAMTWDRHRSSWDWLHCPAGRGQAGARAHRPLMEQVGHTLALAVWGNHGPTIVHWEESPQAVTVNLRLGDVMPLLSSATGRCFAAYSSQEAITPLLKEEIARAQKQGRADVPPSLTEARPCSTTCASAARRVWWTRCCRHRGLLRAGVRFGWPHRAGHRRARADRHLRSRVGRRRGPPAARRRRQLSSDLGYAGELARFRGRRCW
jgi:hypothetical protein